MKSGEGMSGCSNDTMKKLKGELRDMGGEPRDVGAWSLECASRSWALLCAKEEAWPPGFAMSQLEPWVCHFSPWYR